MSELVWSLLSALFVSVSVSAVAILRRRALQTQKPILTRLAIGLSMTWFLALCIPLKIGILPMGVPMFCIIVIAFLIFVIHNYRLFGDLQKLDTTLGRWRS